MVDENKNDKEAGGATASTVVVVVEKNEENCVCPQPSSAKRKVGCESSTSSSSSLVSSTTNNNNSNNDNNNNNSNNASQISAEEREKETEKEKEKEAAEIEQEGLKKNQVENDDNKEKTTAQKDKNLELAPNLTSPTDASSSCNDIIDNNNEIVFHRSSSLILARQRKRELEERISASSQLRPTPLQSSSSSCNYNENINNVNNNDNNKDNNHSSTDDTATTNSCTVTPTKSIQIQKLQQRQRELELEQAGIISPPLSNRSITVSNINHNHDFATATQETKQEQHDQLCHQHQDSAIHHSIHQNNNNDDNNNNNIVPPEQPPIPSQIKHQQFRHQPNLSQLGLDLDLDLEQNQQASITTDEISNNSNNDNSKMNRMDSTFQTQYQTSSILSINQRHNNDGTSLRNEKEIDLYEQQELTKKMLSTTEKRRRQQGSFVRRYRGRHSKKWYGICIGLVLLILALLGVAIYMMVHFLTRRNTIQKDKQQGLYNMNNHTKAPPKDDNNNNMTTPVPNAITTMAPSMPPQTLPTLPLMPTISTNRPTFVPVEFTNAPSSLFNEPLWSAYQQVLEPVVSQLKLYSDQDVFLSEISNHTDSAVEWLISTVWLQPHDDHLVDHYVMALLFLRLHRKLPFGLTTFCNLFHEILCGDDSLHIIELNIPDIIYQNYRDNNNNNNDKNFITDNPYFNVIPQEWQYLSYLQVLNASHNNFTGTLPDFISTLSNLTSLDLSYNNLSIPEYDKTGIPQFPLHLIHLDLSYNNFNGFVPNLSALQHLQFIDLSHNIFTNPQSIDRYLPQSLNSDTDNALANLNLSWNKIQGSLPETFWSDYPNLVFLDLSHNEFVGSFPSMIKTETNVLQTLHLENNEFTGTLWISGIYLQLVIAPFNFFSKFRIDTTATTALRDLILHDNLIEGSVPNMLTQAQNLQTINVQDNLLDGPLPENIGNLGQLVLLNVAYNQLSGTLPSFEYATSLQHFQLRTNRFRGTLDQFMNTASTSITLFWAFDNFFSGTLAKSIGRLLQLEYFSVGYNILTGPIAGHEMQKLQELRDFRLYGNFFNGTLTELFHDNKFAQLETLLLSDNEFTGPFPSSFDALSTSLEVLGMSSNYLTGPLPVSSWSPSLQLLQLDYNLLSGSIPLELFTTCTKLQVLDLSDNVNVTGSIPTHITELQDLQKLDLSNMQLYGTIPKGLFYSKDNITKMEHLDLSFNKLNGPLFSSLSLPLSFASSLRTFNVGYNQFTGTLHPQLDFPHLNLLNVDANQLTGSIPYNIVGPQLRELYMARNQLSGILPQFTTDSVLTSSQQQQQPLLNVDISHNTNLTGSLIPAIPSNIVSIVADGIPLFNHSLPELLDYFDPTTLQVFSCTDCNLRGSIPSDTIADFSMLQQLWLSNNLDLSGTIPSEIGLLDQLSILAIDHTNIHGLIPLQLGLLPIQQINLEFTLLVGDLNFITCPFLSSQHDDDEMIIITADCAGEFPKVPCDCCTTCY